MKYKSPFLQDDVLTIEQALLTESEEYWLRKGETSVLELFHLMALRVPAYKDFLQKKHIDHTKIRTIEDFEHVPPIDKQSYLRQYPREMLCWDGKFSTSQWIISTTSGSTGDPFYFPRQEEQDLQYAYTAELYLRTNFKIQERSTLYIVGFPMGAWIGGVFTYKALSMIQQKGIYNLSIITPGINKLEIIKAVQNLGSSFDQIIIGSYGPFLKDILDEGERYGLQWKQLNMGFVFSAEAFSESFRDYVQKKTGLKNIYVDTLNHYGTVDLGTMSHETPLCVLLRRLGMENKSVYALLFDQILKLPTLTQYNPSQFYFEDVDSSLYCSAYSGLPLIRYDLKDNGGVRKYSHIVSKLQDMGIDIVEEMRKRHLQDTIWKLPFVYVYERSDFSVSFFAFQIYPETIRRALQEELFESFITGKFTMQVLYDDNANQQLIIHIEMKKDMSMEDSVKDKIIEKLVYYLLNENSEYRKTYEEYSKQLIPNLVFWPYEDPTYFRPGVKQKWVKK